MYQGFYLCKELESSLLLRTFPDFLSLSTEISFSCYSFSHFRDELEQVCAPIHLLLIEIPDRESEYSCFSFIRDLTLRIPYCKIIFLVSDSQEYHFHHVTQIPHTYLLPISQARSLLKTALHKAVSELELSNFTAQTRGSAAFSRYAYALFFSTDDVANRGKRGCNIHFPDSRVEYTKASLKSLLPELPDNFIQIHKSYVANMDCCDGIFAERRPSGNKQDKYLLLHKKYHSDIPALPIGPKYEKFVMEYFQNSRNHIPCLTPLEDPEDIP